MIRSLKWHVGALALAAIFMLSAGQAAAQSCFGDCNNSNSLTASDIGRINSTILRCSPCAGGVPGGVAAGCAAMTLGCTAADLNTDGCLRASELGRANQNILRFPPSGCAPPPTATTGGGNPTPTPTGGTQTPKCGNGVVEAPEECDDGGFCSDSTNAGSLCTSDAQCPGGTCGGFGGDGCAANCTNETITKFTFTGALCFGGPTAGQGCSFKSNCVGGSKPGRTCGVPADCPGGTCQSECGAGGSCFGDGECSNNIATNCAVGGPTNPCTAGGTCLNKSRAALIGLGVPILLGPLIGEQTSHYGKPSPNGIIPIANPVNGTTFNPIQVPGLVCACVRGGNDAPAHGPGNSGSGQINCGAGTIANDITIGRDHSSIPPRTCEGGANDGMPCSPRCAAGGTNAGKACRVIGVNATECPGANAGQRQCRADENCPGGNCALNNGGGRCNSASGNAGRICINNSQCNGAGARCEGICTSGANPGVACSCDGTAANCANTTQCGAEGICNVVGSLGGGFCMGPPKFCVGGTTPGKACFNASECGGGTCPGTGSFLAVCDQHSDCPGSLCNSIDDAECNDVDPPPPDGSGGAACREAREICTAGPLLGQPCTSSAFCGSGGTCGSTCNVGGLHPNTCNSPTHITVSGAGGTGAALLLSTTAIGTIGDGGTCGLAAQCTGGTSNGQPCLIDLDCPGGGVCATAVCNGLCTGGSAPGSACLSNANCAGGGICAQGSAFNTKCTASGPCGTGGTCVPVNVGKGIDGLPCTDDDPAAAQGSPQTIPQTTGRSATFIADGNAVPGAQLVHLACVGGTIDPSVCASTVVGTPFNCANILAGNTSTSGVRLANTFPTLDGQTGDGVVSTFLTGR